MVLKTRCAHISGKAEREKIVRRFFFVEIWKLSGFYVYLQREPGEIWFILMP